MVVEGGGGSIILFVLLTCHRVQGPGHHIQFSTFPGVEKAPKGVRSRMCTMGCYMPSSCNCPVKHTHTRMTPKEMCIRSLPCCSLDGTGGTSL